LAFPTAAINVVVAVPWFHPPANKLQQHFPIQLLGMQLASIFQCPAQIPIIDRLGDKSIGSFDNFENF